MYFTKNFSEKSPRQGPVYKREDLHMNSFELRVRFFSLIEAVLHDRIPTENPNAMI